MRAIGIILAGGNNRKMRELSQKLSLIHISGSHKTADSAALTVNYYDFHKSSI